MKVIVWRLAAGGWRLAVTGRKMLDALDFDQRAAAQGYVVAYPDAYN